MRNVVTALLLMLIAGPAIAQEEIFSRSNAAIQGYDLVAYFKDSKPVKGKKNFHTYGKVLHGIFSNPKT